MFNRVFKWTSVQALVCVALWGTSLCACEDQVVGDLNAGAQMPGMYQPPPQGGGTGPYTMAGTSATAGVQGPAGGAGVGTGEPPPFTPPPGARRCEFREQCELGQYCYREYCIDQQPCGEFALDQECPDGYACVGGLCFEDGGEGSCLSVSPTELNFGEVPRGDVATREVTLSACGSAPVSVTQIALNGMSSNTFSVQGGPTTLNPGQSSNFTVSYSPRMVGFDTGSVDVISTDFNNPNQTVRLSATGAPPTLENTGLHVRLEWSTNQTDVDLHLLGPNHGGIWDCDLDCNFSNPTQSWGDPLSDLDDPFLDLDDVDGFGPENINIQDPAPGVYTVVVHYWDSHGGDTPLATVHALSYGEVIATVGPQALNQVGDVWYAFEVEFPGNHVRPINRLEYSDQNIPFCD